MMSIKNDQKNSVLPVVKSGNKVQIGLPVLCSYDDDDDEEDDELTPKPTLKNLNTENNKQIEKPRSGLLGLLPPPKSSQNPFLKKPTTTNSTSNLSSEKAKFEKNEIKKDNPLVPRSVANKKTINFLESQPDNEADSDEESNRKRLKVDQNKSASVHSSKTSKFGSYKDYEEDDPALFEDDNENEEEEEREEVEVPQQRLGTTSTAVFDQEALIKLCGSQGKKNKLDSIEITDVSANEIVGNNRSELMKQITSDYRPPSNKDYFGSSSRRTHQITYLAKVALERDQELKNQWAQSKFNKQQAKQRYGF